MKFLADINIPQSVIKDLSKLGHEVLDIKKTSLTSKDTELIEKAQQDKRIILTLDKDFIALTQYPKYQVPTIIVRLKKQQPYEISKHLKQFLRSQKSSVINKSLTIITKETAESYQY